MSKPKPVLVEKISGKAKYDAVYLGWKECPGLSGVELTEPVIRDMVYGPRPEQFNFDNLPRLTIAVTKSELAITQTIRKGNGKTEKLKFQTIPMKNLTFAARGTSPDDAIVACIVVGYNPASTCWVHIHVYLCETKLEAETFLRHLRQFIDTPAHYDRLQRLEKQMVQKGQIPTPIRSVGSIEGTFSEVVHSSYGTGTGVPLRGTDPTASSGAPVTPMYGQPSGSSEVNIYGTPAEMFPARVGANPMSYGQPPPEVSIYGTSAEMFPQSPKVTSNPMYAPAPEVNTYGTSSDMFPIHRSGGIQSDTKAGFINPYLPSQAVEINSGLDAQYGVHGPSSLPRLSPNPQHRIASSSEASANQLKLNYNQSDDKRSGSPYLKTSNIDGNSIRPISINGASYTPTGAERQQFGANPENRQVSAGVGNQINPAPGAQSAYYDYRQPRQDHPTEDYDSPRSPPPVDYDQGPQSPTLPTTIEDKLAAELKRKLGKGPILLPPKDYDTVNRTHGNLIGIEARKCLNEKIVGKGETDGDEPAEYRPNARPGIFGLGYNNN